MLLPMLAVVVSHATAPKRSTDVDEITVEQRFSGIVCAGLCTNESLTVRSDGLVKLSVGDAVIGSKRHQFRYRISPQQYAKFVSVYAKIRPTGLAARLTGCDPETLVIDFDIRWNDSGAPSRLLACRGEDVRRAYLDGFRALGINLFGGKLTPEDDELLSR